MEEEADNSDKQAEDVSSKNTAPACPSATLRQVVGKNTFSRADKKVLEDGLFVNGEKPETLTQAQIDAAVEFSEEFKRLWEDLLMKKAQLMKSKGSKVPSEGEIRAKARNTIRKSMKIGK